MTIGIVLDRSRNHSVYTFPFPDLGYEIKRYFAANRNNSPLSEWIAYGFDITELLVTERILPVFVKEAKVL